MMAIGNLLQALAGVLHLVIGIFYWVLLARIILSWVSPDPRNPIVQFIYSTTEPILIRVRELSYKICSREPVIGMLDLSPILVFILLYLIDAFLVQTLSDYGARFRMEALQGT